MWKPKTNTSVHKCCLVVRETHMTLSTGYVDNFFVHTCPYTPQKNYVSAVIVSQKPVMTFSGFFLRRKISTEVWKTNMRKE